MSTQTSRNRKLQVKPCQEEMDPGISGVLLVHNGFFNVPSTGFAEHFGAVGNMRP